MDYKGIVHSQSKINYFCFGIKNEMEFKVDHSNCRQILYNAFNAWTTKYCVNNILEIASQGFNTVK